MKQSFKEMKKRADETLASRAYERDEEGRVIVDMTVKDDTDFLSVFSANATPVVSAEVAEFIENGTHSLRPNESLSLRVHSDCIDEEEKTVYEKAIREYYAERYVANERELKRNNIVALLLAAAGVLVLALAISLEYIASSLLWAELIDIVAWVFLWEAVDISALGNRALRLKRLRYLAYMNMKIEFDDR